MEKFTIIKDSTKKVRKYNLTGRTLEFKLRPVPDGVEPISWIREGIKQIVERAVGNLQPTDRVSFTFCSKEFNRGEGWIRFKRASEIKYEDIWDVISSIYQSNSSGLNTESFCLGVTSVRLPAGKGRVNKYNTFVEECGMRKGIITIENKDNLCLPRALVVAMANIEKDPEFRKVRRDIGKIQTKRTKDLMSQAGVTIPEDGAGLPELQKFQRYLKEYKIVVYKYGSKGRDVIFEGTESNKKLNLIHHEGHYNVVTSLTAAFACGYYCEDCHVPHNNKNRHRCGGMCPGCFQSPKCVDDKGMIKCMDCCRYFRGQICHENHLKPGSWEKSTVCKQIRGCDNCFKVIKGGRKHTCGEIFCKTCNTHVPENHLCYIQKDTGKPKTKDVLYVFYDLETRQEEVLENGSLLHQPNLCVFKQCCDECMESKGIICKKCGVRLQTVKGLNPVASFTRHLLEMRKKFKKVVVIAHNGQAFDHQFILNYIMTETDLTPELIMRGTKIIMMEVGNIKFIDSLNYFPMPLKSLPKAFGLGDDFKKGYFPHLFNTKANENYVGPLPAIEYYSPDTMKEGDRNKFLEWYEEHKNDVFDMQKDLVDYCVSDVLILTKACLEFRKQLITTTNVCPFTEATTIASACNKVFRRNFLKPNTIGIIPKNGYRWRDQQSKIAIEWLLWEEKQRGINILHAAKEQEATLHGVKVDGYCSETNQIFEFQGCYYHGCPNCYKFGRNDPLFDDPSQTLDFRYETTMAKIDKLKSFGYDAIEMWECDFRQQLKDNPEINTYTKTHPLVNLAPLNAREAFYGGRTGNVWEYYEAKEGEKIKYVDVCSLYPYVCKYGKFPIGHPEVIVGEECKNLDLSQTDGLIKCSVVPPTNLYHPVLPTKMNSKLMFVLCHTCGEQMTEECKHNEKERTLHGTWVIDEVLKAIEKGYKITNIQEIWKYKTVRFNKETEGLFTSMMNKFIKIKQEASGWPSECTTEEEKNRYIEEFLQREDIQLEYAQIVENPGLRSLAKLILNSFWGKFGQRENQPKTKIINDSSEFFTMLINPALYINGVLPINEKTVIVNYEHVEESYDPLPTVNVAIASYVTAQARLKLYSYLEDLGDRVLYYDTDSVIYVSRNNEPDVPIGQFIGDMTDELEAYGPGSYITHFVSGGPKNYAFKIYSTKNKREEVVCKVKGISLNYEASKLVNFDTIKQMVLTKSDPVPIVSTNIRRTKEHEVVTRTETKLYRPNSTKRKFSPDGSSEPFGYKKLKML
jgi:G:T-mismatch repair DNA endonuclease (very short patch repair protein)